MSFLFFLIFLKILFIYAWETHRERESVRAREREAETQAEGEAGSMQGARCGTWFQVSRITPWSKGRSSTTEPSRRPRTVTFLHRGRPQGNQAHGLRRSGPWAVSEAECLGCFMAASPPATVASLVCEPFLKVTPRILLIFSGSLVNLEASVATKSKQILWTLGLCYRLPFTPEVCRVFIIIFDEQFLR